MSLKFHVHGLLYEPTGAVSEVDAYLTMECYKIILINV